MLLQNLIITTMGICRLPVKGAIQGSRFEGVDTRCCSRFFVRIVLKELFGKTDTCTNVLLLIKSKDLLNIRLHV